MWPILADGVLSHSSAVTGLLVMCGAIARVPSIQAGGDDCAPCQHEHSDDADGTENRRRSRGINPASNTAVGAVARLC